MSFANHNILDIALSIIPPTVVQIRKNLGTAVNKYGQAVASYSEWVEVYGIVQPGGEQNEHVEGIDISKKHVTIWLRGVDLTGTHIQWAPDQIRYVDKIFNVTSCDDWYPYDNYRKCECTEAINLDESLRAKRTYIHQQKKSDTLKPMHEPILNKEDVAAHEEQGLATNSCPSQASNENSASAIQSVPLPSPTSKPRPRIRF